MVIHMNNNKLYDEYIALKNEIESMDINDDMDYYLDLKNEINEFCVLKKLAVCVLFILNICIRQRLALLAAC